MKKRQTIVTFVVLIIALLSATFIYQLKFPNDRCSNRDREIKNCVPAGKCGPTPAIDALIDCEAKNYDKKFNPET